MKEADQVRGFGLLANQKTVTAGWDQLAKTDLHLKKVEVKGPSELQAPCMIFLSEFVPVLVL